MNNGPLEQSSSTGDDPPAPGRPGLLLEMLPNEVLAETIEYLSNDDLLNLPYQVLKNGLLKAEGLRRFGQHRVWMDKKNLYRLARISNHPIIRQYVEELVFYLDKPCEPDKFHIRGHDHVTRRRGWPSLEAKYLAMKKTSDDQQKLTEDGTDIRILVMAFTSLPNAKTVTIDNIDRLGREREELGAALFARQQIYRGEFALRGDHGTYLLTLLIKALAASPVKPDTLQVISEATPAITRPDLRFFYNGGRPRTAISLADLLYTVPSSAYPAAFGEMKKLDLRDLRRTQLEDNYSYCDGNRQKLERLPGSSTKSLERIVKSAVSISDLTIGHAKGISAISSECMLDIQLNSLLGSGGHPHLRILELSDLVTQQWHMVGSLQACAPALTDLTLGTIHLNQGTWARTFDNLKGLFKLERLELGKLSMSGADCKDETGQDNIHDVVGSDDSDNTLGWLCDTIETNQFRPGRNLSELYL
jgi:hypothetical protein